jgi:hypothetical protein
MLLTHNMLSYQSNQEHPYRPKSLADVPIFNNAAGLGNFYGKPYRPVKALDLGKPRPSSTVMALPRVEETEKYEDHAVSVKEEDEEEVRRQKVNRLTHRSSLRRLTDRFTYLRRFVPDSANPCSPLSKPFPESPLVQA